MFVVRRLVMRKQRMQPSFIPWQRFSTSPSQPFRLDPKFVEKYAHIQPPFGFNGLGELVYLRTYARYVNYSLQLYVIRLLTIICCSRNIDNQNRKERWVETVERVVNGTFRMQYEWMLHNQLPWDINLIQTQAEDMFHRIFHMKFLPPGRGLWAMGTPLTEERKLYAALNNCAFVSTQDLNHEPAEPFCFLMDASMLGVGVGFDTKGAK